MYERKNQKNMISEINHMEWLKLNQFLHEIKKINSPCVTVYYPYGKGSETIILLQSTKRNETFEKIQNKIQIKIKELKKNPTSAGKFAKTLCIFGWMNNGKVVIKQIGTSKKLPYIYMTSKKPYIKPFNDILIRRKRFISTPQSKYKSDLTGRFIVRYIVQKITQRST